MMLAAIGMSGGCKLTPGRIHEDQLARDCPTGQCDPDPNGLGIYIAEKHNYCFLVDGAPRMCPEAFVNTPEGVVLKVRDLKNPKKLLDAPVSVSFLSPPSRAPTEMSLLGIHSTPTELAVSYTLDGKRQLAQGAEVARLKFRFPLLIPLAGEDFSRRPYEMTWSPIERREEPAQGEPLPYEVLYRPVDEGPWLRHCQSPLTKAVASLFLPGRRVDGLSAAVTEDPAATTLSCESGAIGTCLGWGYTPWEPESSEPDPRRDHVFRSCLQAKRAAYFVGHGDLRSYTESGTPILRRDEYGYGRDSDDQLDQLPYLEAIWTPRGAACLNMKNRRRNLKIPNTYGVPPCPEPPQWLKDGKLATGVEKPLMP